MMHRFRTRGRLTSILVVTVVTVAACSSARASKDTVRVDPQRVSRDAPTRSGGAGATGTSSTSSSTTRPPVPPPSRRPPAPPTTASPLATAPARVQGVFAIGDSVMLGAAPQLRGRGVAVDAVESRQWGTGTSILARMAAGGRLPPTVVVHLGTNGAISASQFDAMMRTLAGRHVVFLTVHEPRSWEAEVNATLHAGVARWPGTVLLDWGAASTPHPEWFWSDRIHLRPGGAQAYAALVAAAA